VSGADIYYRSAPSSPAPVAWRWFRRVIIFLLGVALIIEARVSDRDRIVTLIAGLVMVGLLPLDDLIRALRAPKRLDGDELEVGRIDGPEPANLPSDQTGEPIDPGPSNYRSSP
jgi:hypothetical protein